MESNKNGWKSNEAVDNYHKVIDFIVPRRREILNTIARIATLANHENLKILDIGCGSGDVTEEIMKFTAKGASFTLVDFSEAMLKLSQERFKENHNVEILRHDLNNGLPETVLNQKYDAVVSCFALHHIEYCNRVKLYSDIHKVLHKNAFFINGDMFKGDSQLMNDWEFNNWIDWMVVNLKENLGWEITYEDMKKRQLESFEKMGDKPGTIWDMAEDLKAAGFRNVDCMLKVQNLAVITAAE